MEIEDKCMKLSNKAKRIAADISEKYSFCYYCSFKLSKGSSGDEDYINSYFYKLYWASTMAVVIEGVTRLSKYEEFSVECNEILEYCSEPFKKIQSDEPRWKVLKDFRDHMFHSQEKYRNDKRRIVFENDFPYSELKQLTFLLRDKLVKKIRQDTTGRNVFDWSAAIASRDQIRIR